MVTVVVAIGSVALLLPAVHWAAWGFIPPLSTRSLAKKGHFVSVNGIDTYYERYGSGRR